MISNETVSAAGQNEVLYRKPPTLCQRFAEMKSFLHYVKINSNYVVLSYKLKPIFALKISWEMDHVNVNLSCQLASIKKYTYTQANDYLKTKYPNSRGFSERTLRRYCKGN